MKNQPIPDEVQLRSIASTIAKKMSHDIRTPFNASIGVMNLIIEEWPSLEDNIKIDLMQTLVTSSKEQLKYLDMLLFWSRAELGEIRNQVNHVSLLEYAQKIQHTVTAANITVEVNNLQHDHVVLLFDFYQKAMEVLLFALSELDSIHPIRIIVSEENSVLVCTIYFENRSTMTTLFPAYTQQEDLPALTGFALFFATRLFTIQNSIIQTQDEYLRIVSY